MRKWISLLLCLLLTVPVTVGAEEIPESQNPPEEHTHSWTTETVAATCTQAGSTTQTCSCGQTNTQTIPATGHSFGSWTDAGDGTHSRTCSVCAAPESAGHSWGEGQVTAAASCTATGTKVYTCGCGASKSETIPITDHAYGGWTVDETSHSRACACGKTESGSHSWDVSVTVPATCLQEGAIAYGCSTCEAIATEILPKLTTHTYDNGCDPECNICGNLRDASHKFSSQWSRNGRGHWHACAACGEQKDFGDHYPGPAATEEKAQICLTCGYTLTAKLGHKHKYAAQWTSDETGHWYACSGCEDKKDLEDHEYDDPCDPDCNVCGFVTATAHSYSGTWLSDIEGHWDVCTLCQEESAREEHIPGPEATEKEAQLCVACGFELAPVQAHVHVPEGEWRTDEASHWKVCACGEDVEKVSHNWNEGAEQKDTTVVYTCEDCGVTRTEGEPKTGVSPLVWAGIAMAALLGTAAALLLLMSHLKKGGKYGK